MPSGAERFPTFTPALATITAITRAENAVVQTSFPHTFRVGEYVKLLVPREYGMTQMNNVTGLITFISAQLPDFFRTNINSTAFDAFVVPVNPLQSAQAVPSGEVATTLLGANKNVLPYP